MLWLSCPGIIIALIFSFNGERNIRGIHEIDALRYRDWSVNYQDGYSILPLVPRVETTVTCAVYGYMPYWTTQQYLHFDLLTTIGCFDVTLNPDGSITNAHGFPRVWAATINRAHRNGVRVEMVATCFGAANVHGAITSGADSAISNLVRMASAAGVDGINIDFEGISGADRDTLVSFVRRLSAACRSAGLTLTMATMPLDFVNAYNFRALAETTDGLFIMAYNYHWQGGPEAGPVSPLTGWTYYGNIQMTIEEYRREIGDCRKLFLGIPYYGYQWPTRAETTHSRTTGYGEALSYSQAAARAARYGRRWDGESQTPWYRFYQGGWYQGWFDDDTSLLLKFNEVHEHGFLGTGMWALGYDGGRKELWSALREAFNRPLASFVNGDCEIWRLDTLAVPSDTSVNPFGWYEGRRAKYRRETGIVHSGTSAIKHIPDSLGYPGPVDSRLFQDVMVLPGRSYEFRGWVYKNDGRGNQLRLIVDWYDSLHRVIASASSPVVARDSAGWVELTTGTITAPDGAVMARLNLGMLGYGGLDYWDDLSFEIVPGAMEGYLPGLVKDRGGVPTFVGGILYLPESFVGNREQNISLLDATGRRVVKLRSGENNLSNLPAGVYFLHTTPGQGVVQKLIIRKAR